MKFSKTLILTLAIGGFFAESANAECPRRTDFFICPGDKVVSSDPYQGTVVGVNRAEGLVSFKNSGGYLFTRKKEQIALGMGCVEDYCVGDAVTYDNFIREDFGTIVGVNPYARQIAIGFPESKSNYIALRDLEDVKLGVGCVSGFCVGDTVTSENHTGTVVGVNRFRNQVSFSVKGQYGWLIKHEWEHYFAQRTMYLTLGALNDIFGDNERSYPRFPLLDEKLYNAPDLKFSWKRPVARH